jgi:hypothetical protein
LQCPRIIRNNEIEEQKNTNEGIHILTTRQKGGEGGAEQRKKDQVTCLIHKEKKKERC